METMVHGPVVLSKANRVYNVGDIDLNLNNIVLLVFFLVAISFLACCFVT